MNKAELAPVNWPLLGLPDSEGRLRYPGLDESVRQSIKIILQTRPGERLMRPHFGGGLERLLYEPNTLTTRRRIRDLITESLAGRCLGSRGTPGYGQGGNRLSSAPHQPGAADGHYFGTGRVEPGIEP